MDFPENQNIIPEANTETPKPENVPETQSAPQTQELKLEFKKGKNKLPLIIGLIVIVALGVGAYFLFFNQPAELDFNGEMSQEWCEDNKKQIKKELESLDVNGEHFTASSTIDDVFYSPSQNACLYAEIIYYYKPDPITGQNMTYSIFSIFDYPSNKRLFRVDEFDDPEARSVFEDKKQELSG
jgi:flagellar basal body-associated protein FliL